MLRLLNQMLKLPVAAFVYGMEMLVKTMQGMQKMADQGVDAVLQAGLLPESEATGESGTEYGLFGSSAPPASSEYALYGGAANTNHATHMEESKMADQDLRGDDAKLVRYSICFIRRDFEAFLAEDTEVVSYSTTEGDYQGSKKAEYLADLRHDGAERPRKWKLNNYPADEYLDPGDKNRFVNLPGDDFDEFVRVKVEVLARYERKPGQYDKDQADALKTLASAVKEGVIQVNK